MGAKVTKAEEEYKVNVMHNMNKKVGVGPVVQMGCTQKELQFI